MSATAEQRSGAVVEQLRERIRQFQAAPRSYLATLRTGVEEVDALLPSGGFPLGQAVELCGEAASGRTSLALRAVAAAHRERRLCAWVDGPKELYPPAAAAMGVDLSRLLIIRPKEPSQLAWTAVQLARSGAFACVVLDLNRGLAAEASGGKSSGVRLSLAEGKKLADAAFRGGSLLLLLSSPSAPADGVTRMRTESLGPEGLAVEVVRSRQGGLGTRAVLPWSSLYPALGPEGEETMLLAGEAPRGEDLVPDFYRGRSWEQRNACGILGQRPGRDAPMPSMRSVMKTGTGPR
jgi:hypothetical protein